jgi:hypothetical protein
MPEPFRILKIRRRWFGRSSVLISAPLRGFESGKWLFEGETITLIFDGFIDRGNAATK